MTELRDAEVALASLQTHLSGALRQKERLAQLGGAVAKISHDLRNILTTAQLFGDRLERSEDPMVKRAAPKLVNSIARAVSLCESTLAFGKAEETERDWTIRIRDTGPGLPVKARDHLFQPFQGGARKGGFGLGLAIAMELVRGHGGRLALEQSGPDGTCFAVILPKVVVELDAAAE